MLKIVKMRVFIREIRVGASIILLFSSMAVPSYAQFVQSPSRFKTEIISASAKQDTPLTLRFDGIDLSSFENARPDTVKRDIYSRVRSAVKRAGIQASPAEIESATNKIIKLLRSDYVREELAKNTKALITINVDLTFQPLTTEVTFQF